MICELKKLIRTTGAPQPIGPYSQAIEAGNFLFISGQGAIDPQTSKMVTGDIEAQTQRTLENVKSIVEAAGFAMKDVVKVSVFLRKMADFQKMNAVYKEYFAENPPARTTVEAVLPVADMLIEIDVIASR